MTEAIYGTDPRELSRTEDPDTSKKAAYKVDNAQWEKLVHSHIVGAGFLGVCQKELELAFGPENNKSISPRFAPLRRKGLIFDSGLRRNGCIVWMDCLLRDRWWLTCPEEARQKMEESETRRGRRVQEQELQALLAENSTLKELAEQNGKNALEAVRQLQALREAIEGALSAMTLGEAENILNAALKQGFR